MIALLTTLALMFSPKHVMYSEERSCGASNRFMKEKVKIVEKDGDIYVNGIKWKLEQVTNDGSTIISFHLNPKQFMGMSMLYNQDEAWLTLWGIDEYRKPCSDRIYLRAAGHVRTRR